MSPETSTQNALSDSSLISYNINIQIDDPSKTNTEEAENIALPSGWERSQTSQGRTYYIDHISHITTFDAPSSASLRPIAPVTGPLPAGWELRTNPQGCEYFIDHNTKRTSYIDPRRLTAENLQAVNHAMEEGGPLPAGWEVLPSITSGKVYFVDHNTKTTTWDDPRRSTQAETDTSA
jgi:uncharacterized protein YbdZ (MbtH family)